MNGPVKMYKIPQIIRHDLPIEVPGCMYEMKKILSHSSKINFVGSDEHHKHVSSSSPSPSSSSTTSKKTLDISEQKYQKHPDMAALQVRQEIILKQLAELKEQMLSVRTALNVTSIPGLPGNVVNTSCVISSNEVENESDLVINASPSNPPYSLLLLQRLWANSVQLVIRTYLHSTTVNVRLPKVLQEFESRIIREDTNCNKPQLLVRLIWKEVDGNMELITSSSLNMPIHGEPNILRYLSRVGPSNWNYETRNTIAATEIDSALDICYLLSRARTKTERHALLQTLNGKLGKSQWLCNCNEMTIADVAAHSVIKQVTNTADVNVNLTKWMQRCEL